MRTFAIAVLLVFCILALASIVVVEFVQRQAATWRGRRRLTALERAYAAPCARHGEYPHQDWCSR